jgi:hypothetical protein
MPNATHSRSHASSMRGRGVGAGDCMEHLLESRGVIPGRCTSRYPLAQSPVRVILLGARRVPLLPAARGHRLLAGSSAADRLGDPSCSVGARDAALLAEWLSDPDYWGGSTSGVGQLPVEAGVGVIRRGDGCGSRRSHPLRLTRLAATACKCAGGTRHRPGFGVEVPGRVLSQWQAQRSCQVGYGRYDGIGDLVGVASALPPAGLRQMACEGVVA